MSEYIEPSTEPSELGELSASKQIMMGLAAATIALGTIGLGVEVVEGVHSLIQAI